MWCLRWQSRINSLSGLNGKVKEIQNKLEYAEMNLSKRSVILSGFEASEKRGECYKQLNEFFETKMDVQVVIEDYYMIGSAEPRDIVIILLSNQHKHAIFQNIDRIKNTVNRHGKKYRFRDLLTARQNEKRKKGQYIADVEAAKEKSDREEVSTGSGNIYVGEKVYNRKVNEPDPTELLRMSIPQLNEVMMMEVEQGTVSYKNGNKFTPYTAAVSEYEDISKMYMKIRLNHAEARHIVCAWRVPGIDVHEANDGCDDDDHGISSAILEWMKTQQITHRVLFVVRNCGEKLKNDRIPMYIQACERVVSEYPENKLLKKHQIPIGNRVSPDKSYATAAGDMRTRREPDQKNRGRGQGFVRRRGNRGRGNRGRGRGGYRHTQTTNEDPDVYIPTHGKTRTDKKQYAFSDPIIRQRETEDMEAEGVD